MEFGSIERHIHIDASPEVVFDVVSSPEHVKEWWADETDFQPVPGTSGELVWGDDENPRAHVANITVVEAEPNRLFSFRWVYDDGVVPGPDNSLLVRFELTPSGSGTDVRMTEHGFRERGWEVAVLEAHYDDHVNGWNTFIPRLGEYVAQLVVDQ